MATNASTSWIKESLFDAILAILGLGYLSTRLKADKIATAAPAGAAPATGIESALKVSGLDVLSPSDEVLAEMVWRKMQEKLESSGQQYFDNLMETIGQLGPIQRNTLQYSLGKEASAKIEMRLKTLGKAARPLAKNEIDDFINEMKKRIQQSAPGATIDEAALRAYLESIQFLLQENPLEVIDEVLEEMSNSIYDSWIKWNEQGELKKRLIAQKYIPEFDVMQWAEDFKEKINNFWKEWREREKIISEVEAILRPISREIKSLDYTILKQLEENINIIRENPDLTARLQEAKLFKTTYETQHKQDAESRRAEMNQEHKERMKKWNNPLKWFKK